MLKFADEEDECAEENRKVKRFVNEERKQHGLVLNTDKTRHV